MGSEMCIRDRSDTISILLGKGDGTFKAPVAYATGSLIKGQRAIAVDINHDGNLDLLVSNGISNTVSILLGNGDGTFNPKVDYKTGSEPGLIVVADVNYDGKPDMLIENRGGKTVSVLLNNSK